MNVFGDDSVVSVVVPVTISRPESSADWAAGPWPIPFGTTTTTREARSTYFHGRVAMALYGTDEHPSRWWRAAPAGVTFRALAVTGIEILAEPWDEDDGERRRGYLVIHVEAGSAVAAHLAVLAFGGGDAFDDDREQVRELSAGVCELPDDMRLFRRRLMTVSYARFAEEEVKAPYRMRSDVSPRSQWLFALASAVPIERFEPDPDVMLPAETTLSVSWRGMVIRDGAAFIARPEADSYLDRGMAAALVQSVYLDALLLGRLQVDSLSQVAEELSTVLARDVRSAIADLRRIQFDLDRFRSILWWDDVTAHGAANDILRAFQAQHATEKLLDKLVEEVNARVAFYSMLQSERTNWLLNLIAVVGLPIGVGLSLAQIITTAGVFSGAVSLLFSVGFAALLGGLLYLMMGSVELRDRSRARSKMDD